MNRTKRANDSLVNSILFSDDSNNNFSQPINASQSTPGFQRSRLTPTRTFSTSPYKSDYRYDISADKESRITPRFNKNEQGKPTKQPPLSSIFDQYSQEDSFQNKPSQSFTRSEISTSNEIGALTTYEKENSLSSQPFLSPTIDYTEANWQKWIVVYGLPTDLTNFHPILSKFQKFGDINSFSAGKGNWLFIKFDSSSNARRACVDSVLAYKDDLLLGVSQMTSSLALNLGVSLSAEGNINENFGSNSFSNFDRSSDDNGIRQRKVAVNELDTYRNSYLNPASKSSDENIELYIRPQKPKNICEQIMSYFWSY